jgi:predicted DCC family thiol-disulfide oxidoreductase YuxK
MVVDLICPKCGGHVVWCNGGDVIYDYSSQYKATCPSCGYEDWESNFLRDKEQTVSFTAGQAEKRYQQIKDREKEVEELLRILAGDKETQKPKRKNFLKRLIDRIEERWRFS